MYYTIEGKRFLYILYLAGLLLGTIVINVAISMNVFRPSDFLGFIEYMKSLDGLDHNALFSYVCLVRIRQLIIFFVSIFLFSPYVVYCILDFVVSFFTGFFISTLVIRYGWAGMIKALGFFIPHYLFYGMVLLVIYIYLFQKSPLSRFYLLTGGHGCSWIKNGRLLENRVFVVIFCLVMFGAGCYSEAYLSPGIVNIFFPK